MSAKKSAAKASADNAIDIFTDGACSGNPGPGGWGAVLLWQGSARELKGGAAATTNNRMELPAMLVVDRPARYVALRSPRGRLSAA